MARRLESIKTNVLCVPPRLVSDFSSMQRSSLELSDAFAKIVQEYREEKGFSRAKLAEKSGLHQTYIGLLERGKRSPNLDTANSIARAFGVPLWKMLKESEKSQGN